MRSLILPLAFALVAGGCATKADFEDLESQLRERAVRQDREMERLLRQQEALQDSIARISSAIFDLRGTLGRQIVEVQDQLVTLQELTGQSQRNLASLRDQIESQRRTFVPSGDAGREGGGSDAGGGDPGGGPGAGVLPGGGDRPGGGGGGDAQELYNVAVSQFNRGSFATARRAFQQFLDAHPNHQLAADARFYLADILVQENRLDEAVEAFRGIPERYPASSRVPDALYRLGVLHLELDETEEARGYLERVVNSYPDAGVAVLARERLEEIGNR